MRTQTVITLPRLHPAQQTIKHNRRRFTTIRCGRRFGKNVLEQDRAIEVALVHRKACAWMAPTYKQLADDWLSISTVLAPVTVRRNVQEKALALIGGGTIDFWSLDAPEAIRGRRYAHVIVNEAAIVQDLVTIWHNIIRPTLIDYKGSADFVSTPKGLNGFWQLCQVNDPEWAHFHYTTYDNPHMDRAEIEATRATMTERAYQQEIAAEFLPDGAGVFRNVRAVSCLRPMEAQAGGEYVIGVDWGRANDYTVASVWDVRRRCEVYIDRFTGVPWNLQYDRIASLASRYHDALVIAEANNAQDAHIDALVARSVRVMPFVTSNANKAYLIEVFAAALENASIQLQDDDIGMLEMESLESDRTMTGLVRYGAPAGGHDDIPMARIIAYSGIVDSVALPWG